MTPNHSLKRTNLFKPPRKLHFSTILSRAQPPKLHLNNVYNLQFPTMAKVQKRQQNAIILRMTCENHYHST